MPPVLFADADREFCDDCGSLLSSNGFQVETATDGLECLDKLRQSVPDFLILDLELPWGGGDGVLAVMHEDPQLHTIPVVLTSTVIPARVLDHLLATWLCVQALTKPFRLADLLDCLTIASSNMQTQPSNGAHSLGILVVDDESAIRNLLQTQLHRRGFRVWTAGKCEDALDHCCNHGEEIAVVLLDICTPRLDGPRILEGIREFNPEMPVCFMTSDPGEFEPSDLLARGARHVFRKPLCIDEVVRVVRHLANEPVIELQAN